MKIYINNYPQQKLQKIINNCTLNKHFINTFFYSQEGIFTLEDNIIKQLIISNDNDIQSLEPNIIIDKSIENYITQYYIPTDSVCMTINTFVYNINNTSFKLYIRTNNTDKKHTINWDKLIDFYIFTSINTINDFNEFLWLFN